MNLFKSMVAISGLMLSLSGVAHAKNDMKIATPVAAPIAATSATTSTKTARMDINSATVKELATLPKIGDVRAAAIVKGRPYKAKDELVEKKILGSDVYATIKEMIIAKQGPKTKAPPDKKK